MDEATYEAMDRCLRRFAQGWHVGAGVTMWVKSGWWTEAQDMTPAERALMASYFPQAQEVQRG